MLPTCSKTILHFIVMVFLFGLYNQNWAKKTLKLTLKFISCVKSSNEKQNWSLQLKTDPKIVSVERSLLKINENWKQYWKKKIKNNCASKRPFFPFFSVNLMSCCTKKAFCFFWQERKKKTEHITDGKSISLGVCFAPCFTIELCLLLLTIRGMPIFDNRDIANENSWVHNKPHQPAIR